MDKLFSYNLDGMFKQLKDVASEMEEDSYSDYEKDPSFIAEPASEYIKTIFAYMKKRYCSEECTVLNLMKELYRIAATGEYAYIQEIEDITTEDSVFESMNEKNGCETVLYAARLLRYYYLIKEKLRHKKSVWRQVEEIYKKINGLGESGPLRKLEKCEKKDIENYSDRAFMVSLHNHLNKSMAGQHELKKKLCSVICQYKYHNERSVLLIMGPTGSGKNHVIETIRSYPELGIPVVIYDCSALTPNGFKGADAEEIIKKVSVCVRNFNPAAAKGQCIVYLDEIDKIVNYNHDSNGESVNAMVQQQILSMLAGTTELYGIDTSKLLFILGGAFPRIDDLKSEKEKNPVGFNTGVECRLDFRESLRDDIMAIGGEAEFVGRIEDIVELSRLTRSDLKAVLLDKNFGILEKKKRLYRKVGLQLEMDEDAVDVILDLVEKETAGARSVKNIINHFADNRYFYDMMVGEYDTMRIHKGMLLEGEEPIFSRKGESDEKNFGYF